MCILVILCSAILLCCPSCIPQTAVKSCNRQNFTNFSWWNYKVFTMWYFRTWPVNHGRMPDPRSRSKEFYLNLLECHRMGLICSLYNKNINTLQILIYKNVFEKQHREVSKLTNITPVLYAKASGFLPSWIITWGNDSFP